MKQKKLFRNRWLVRTVTAFFIVSSLPIPTNTVWADGPRPIEDAENEPQPYPSIPIRADIQRTESTPSGIDQYSTQGFLGQSRQSPLSGAGEEGREYELPVPRDVLALRNYLASLWPRDASSLHYNKDSYLSRIMSFVSKENLPKIRKIATNFVPTVSGARPRGKYVAVTGDFPYVYLFMEDGTNKKIDVGQPVTQISLLQAGRPPEGSLVPDPRQDLLNLMEVTLKDGTRKFVVVNSGRIIPVGSLPVAAQRFNSDILTLTDDGNFLIDRTYSTDGQPSGHARFFMQVYDLRNGQYKGWGEYTGPLQSHPNSRYTGPADSGWSYSRNYLHGRKYQFYDSSTRFLTAIYDIGGIYNAGESATHPVTRKLLIGNPPLLPSPLPQPTITGFNANVSLSVMDDWRYNEVEITALVVGYQSHDVRVVVTPRDGGPVVAHKMNCNPTGQCSVKIDQMGTDMSNRGPIVQRLGPDTEYTYYIQTRDANGDVVTSREHSFKTLQEPGPVVLDPTLTETPAHVIFTAVVENLRLTPGGQFINRQVYLRYGNARYVAATDNWGERLMTCTRSASNPLNAACSVGLPKDFFLPGHSYSWYVAVSNPGHGEIAKSVTKSYPANLAPVSGTVTVTPSATGPVTTTALGQIMNHPNSLLPVPTTRLSNKLTGDGNFLIAISYSTANQTGGNAKFFVEVYNARNGQFLGWGEYTGPLQGQEGVSVYSAGPGDNVNVDNAYWTLKSNYLWADKFQYNPATRKLTAFYTSVYGLGPVKISTNCANDPLQLHRCAENLPVTRDLYIGNPPVSPTPLPQPTITNVAASVSLREVKDWAHKGSGWSWWEKEAAVTATINGYKAGDHEVRVFVTNQGIINPESLAGLSGVGGVAWMMQCDAAGRCSAKVSKMEVDTDRIYNYIIQVRDKNGNVVQTSTRQFPPLPQQPGPATIQNVTVTETATTVTFTADVTNWRTSRWSVPEVSLRRKDDQYLPGYGEHRMTCTPTQPLTYPVGGSCSITLQKNQFLPGHSYSWYVAVLSPQHEEVARSVTRTYPANPTLALQPQPEPEPTPVPTPAPIRQISVSRPQAAVTETQVRITGDVSGMRPGDEVHVVYTVNGREVRHSVNGPPAIEFIAPRVIGGIIWGARYEIIFTETRSGTYSYRIEIKRGRQVLAQSTQPTRFTVRSSASAAASQSAPQPEPPAEPEQPSSVDRPGSPPRQARYAYHIVDAAGDIVNEWGEGVARAGQAVPVTSEEARRFAGILGLNPEDIAGLGPYKVRGSVVYTTLPSSRVHRTTISPLIMDAPVPAEDVRSRLQPLDTPIRSFLGSASSVVLSGDPVAVTGLDPDTAFPTLPASVQSPVPGLIKPVEFHPWIDVNAIDTESFTISVKDVDPKFTALEIVVEKADDPYYVRGRNPGQRISVTCQPPLPTGNEVPRCPAAVTELQAGTRYYVYVVYHTADYSVLEGGGTFVTTKTVQRTYALPPPTQVMAPASGTGSVMPPSPRPPAAEPPSVGGTGALPAVLPPDMVFNDDGTWNIVDRVIGDEDFYRDFIRRRQTDVDNTVGSADSIGDEDPVANTNNGNTTLRVRSIYGIDPPGPDPLPLAQVWVTRIEDASAAIYLHSGSLGYSPSQFKLRAKVCETSDPARCVFAEMRYTNGINGEYNYTTSGTPSGDPKGLRPGTAHTAVVEQIYPLDDPLSSTIRVRSRSKAVEFTTLSDPASFPPALAAAKFWVAHIGPFDADVYVHYPDIAPLISRGLGIKVEVCKTSDPSRCYSAVMWHTIQGAQGEIENNYTTSTVAEWNNRLEPGTNYTVHVKAFSPANGSVVEERRDVARFTTLSLLPIHQFASQSQPPSTSISQPNPQSTSVSTPAPNPAQIPVRTTVPAAPQTPPNTASGPNDLLTPERLAFLQRQSGAVQTTSVTTSASDSLTEERRRFLERSGSVQTTATPIPPTERDQRSNVNAGDIVPSEKSFAKCTETMTADYKTTTFSCRKTTEAEAMSFVEAARNFDPKQPHYGGYIFCTPGNPSCKKALEKIKAVLPDAKELLASSGNDVLGPGVVVAEYIVTVRENNPVSMPEVRTAVPDPLAEERRRFLERSGGVQTASTPNDLLTSVASSSPIPGTPEYERWKLSQISSSRANDVQTILASNVPEGNKGFKLLNETYTDTSSNRQLTEQVFMGPSYGAGVLRSDLQLVPTTQYNFSPPVLSGKRLLGKVRKYRGGIPVYYWVYTS